MRESVDMARKKRLQMVRDAYWEGSDEYGFGDLHDVIVNVLGVTPTPVETRAVLNLLPKIIIGGAVKWGMYDTEVRDGVYVVIEEHRDQVRLAIGVAAECSAHPNNDQPVVPR